jgi:Domain of unknown function (DUF4326)
VSGKVIHLRNGVNGEGSVAEGVVYIGDRMPPSMSPTGKYLPRSDWYNPFKIDKPDKRREGTRREGLERFERYIRTRADLTSRLPELEGKTLACWCAGKEGTPEILTADDDLFCHGQILLRVLREYV